MDLMEDFVNKNLGIFGLIAHPCSINQIKHNAMLVVRKYLYTVHLSREEVIRDSVSTREATKLHYPQENNRDRTIQWPMNQERPTNFD